jgi:hypothetical protein
MSKRFPMALTRQISARAPEGQDFFSMTVFHLFHPVGIGA